MKNKNIVTVLLISFILASCAPAATVVPTRTAAPASTFTPIPTATSTTAPTPTITSTSTATPIPTIPKERFTKDFLDVALPSQELIAQGLKTGVIRQTIDVSKLTFDVHENLNKPGQQIVFGRNPETKEIILATRIDPETGEMVWHVAGLRDLADAVGMTMGTNLYSSSWYGPGNSIPSKSHLQQVNKLVIQEYNHAIVIEVGWMNLEKDHEGEFDFSRPDEAVNLALKNGMTVEGDDLIFGRSNFLYSFMGNFETDMKNQGLNKDQIKARLESVVKNHIIQVMSHFKGRITEYSVLNEWRGVSESENPDFYSKLYGNDDEFIKMVFETARQTDPAARLFYNDAFINTPKDWNYKYAFAHVQKLKNMDLIDAIGIQMTDILVSNPPKQSEIITTMQSWDLPVIVSSATFETQNVKGTDLEVQQKQAEVAVQMLDACVKSGVCKDFRFWDGYGDLFSFHGADARATIFDENMKPKLAYFAIKEYLSQMIAGK